MAAGRILLSCMPALNSNSRPVSGAQLNFYENNTTTRQATYTDSTLTIAHPNPLVADAAGVFPAVFADMDDTYSATCFAPNGTMLPRASYSDVVASTMVGSLVTSAFGLDLVQSDDTVAAAPLVAPGVYAEPFIGSALRTLDDKLTGINDANDFLGPTVDPDDILTDWEPAINASLLSGPGGLVPASWRARVPPGYRRINAGLTMTQAGGILQSDGKGCSLYAPTHNFDMITISAGDCMVRDLRILTDAHGATQKWAIKINAGGSGYVIDHMDLVNVFSGINHQTINGTLDSIHIAGLKPAQGVAIRVSHTSANILASKIFAGDGSNFPGQQAFAGLLIIECGCIQIGLSQFFKMGTALLAQPTGGGTAGSIRSIGNEYDTSDYGVVLDGTNGFVTVPTFIGDWMNSHTHNGFRAMGKVIQANLAGCDTSLNGLDGMLWVNAAGIEVSGHTAAGNGGSGARFDDAHNGNVKGSFGVMGYSGIGGPPGNSQYGIQVTNNGASDLKIEARANGNTVGASVNLSGGTGNVITIL